MPGRDTAGSGTDGAGTAGGSASEPARTPSSVGEPASEPAPEPARTPPSVGRPAPEPARTPPSVGRPAPEPARTPSSAGRPAPAPGRIAFVRQRRWLVEEVAEPGGEGEATLVHLSCLDDDAQGQPLAVLWEHELDARVLEDDGWRAVAGKGFDEPALFAAYLRTLSWNCVTATDPNLFQAPFRAGIRIDAYQLEPLWKALRLPRVKTSCRRMLMDARADYARRLNHGQRAVRCSRWLPRA